MQPEERSDETLERYRALVRAVLRGASPQGPSFDACRAVIQEAPESDAAFPALCMLLEGALADPRTPIDDTQLLVPLIKDLARGLMTPGELV